MRLRDYLHGFSMRLVHLLRVGACSMRTLDRVVSSSRYPILWGCAELMLLNTTGRLTYHTVLPTPCLQT